MAPWVGFEPTTNWLTVNCATAAPPRNKLYKLTIYHSCNGGRGWIRTNEAIKRRIYSPDPLSTRVTLPKFVAGYSFQRQAFVLTVYGLAVRSYLRGTSDVLDLYPSLTNTNRWEGDWQVTTPAILWYLLVESNHCNWCHKPALYHWAKKALISYLATQETGIPLSYPARDTDISSEPIPSKFNYLFKDTPAV